LPDLFLDFTSRQIRRYYGLFDLPEAQHLEVLRRWINVAAWMASDFCLVPIGFTLECDLLRGALERKADLLKAGLIELPLRGSFDEFLVRRRETYRPYASDHVDLYQDEIAAFVMKFSGAFKDRRSQSADSLIDRWSAGPDESPLWRPVERLGLRATRRIAKIPELIHRNDAGIVWQGIQGRLADTDREVEDHLQRILQSDFVESYCEEYRTDTLHDLRHGWRSLRRGACGDPALSYRNFEIALEPLGIRGMVEMMAAESMILLRARPGYLDFIAKYRLLAGEREALKRCAADYGKKLGARGATLVGAARPRAKSGQDWVLTSGELDEMDEILAQASESMPGVQTLVSQSPATRHQPVEDIGMQQKRIAIFVALDEERQVLERSNLKLSRTEHDHYLVGEKASVRLEVYCAHAMGRVAAAVATMEYLQQAKPKPDLLLVTGLAGGFADAKVSEGAVMVPEQIFDLALRKIKDSETPEFRLEAYRSDQRLKRYLESNLFR